MRVDIVVRSGPATGRRILLRSGQIARFGRSDWADFAFNEDHAMADVQFEIRCDEQHCELVAVAKDVPTLVNNAAAARASLKSGDIVSAGRTQLLLQIEGATQAFSPGAESIQSAQPKMPADHTYKLSVHYELTAPAQALAKSFTDDSSKFEEALMSAGHLQDAVRWRAYYVPKPASVQWALACLNSEPTLLPLEEPHATAQQIATDWSAEPSEEKRLVAAAHLDQHSASGLGGMLAAAVAWSGGSLAPPGQPIVPPDERMTGQCVTTAMTMITHLARSPGSADERRKRYLSIRA